MLTAKIGLYQNPLGLLEGGALCVFTLTDTVAWLGSYPVGSKQAERWDYLAGIIQ